MNDAPHEPLASRLRRLRSERGLSIADVAALSNVRRVYLEALEEGRFDDLPEDVFAQNFVRLYAQALGVDAGELLAAYRRDRRGSEPRPESEAPVGSRRRITDAPDLRSRDGVARPGVQEFPPKRRLRGRIVWAIVGATALVIALAWRFDLLAPQVPPTTAAPAPNAPSTPTTSDASSAVTETNPPVESAASAPLVAGPVGERSVTVEIVTEPPGATVSVDGFPLPGRTPITAPVTARAGRVIRAELDGHLPTDVRLDLLTDARIALTLDPRPDDPTPEPTPPPPSGLTIVVSEAAWLEVFRSSARNEGERLVYTNAAPGSRFDVEPPVFVFSGNAGAVELILDGVSLGTLGGAGQVTGRPIGR